MTKSKSPSLKKTLKKNNTNTKTKTKASTKSKPVDEIVSDVTQEEIFGEVAPVDIEKLITVVQEPEVQPEKKIRPRDKVHYVNSREFEDEIRNYYKTGNITDKLGDSLNKIANGLSYAPNFLNYSFKDEMVGDAIVKMFAALKNKKFKIDCGFSPFSYFTTIAFHAFINRIKKEKKHHEVINEYRDKVYNELMIEAGEAGGGHIYVEPTGDDDYEE
jgi:hypothetical protein